MTIRSRVKYGKVFLVVALTVLIWVFADRAQDETYELPNPTISVVKTANPNIWVSFSEEPSVVLERLVLKGPASRVADVKRQMQEGSLAAEFFLDPAQEREMTVAGVHPLDVLSFIRRSDKLNEMRLTVESCKPQTLFVDIQKLMKKTLTVKCVDENNNPVEQVTPEPGQVDMPVPEGWQGERLVAWVKLTSRERDLTRQSPIERKPYIVLAPGWTREVPTVVKVKISRDEDLLRDYQIKAPTLGIALSRALQGKYRVGIKNLETVTGSISVKATLEAKLAYESMSTTRFKVTLEIDDTDVGKEEAKRELTYNFPAEFVRRGEIELKGQPVVARFKLIPVTSAE